MKDHYILEITKEEDANNYLKMAKWLETNEKAGVIPIVNSRTPHVRKLGIVTPIFGDYIKEDGKVKFDASQKKVSLIVRVAEDRIRLPNPMPISKANKKESQDTSLDDLLEEF